VVIAVIGAGLAGLSAAERLQRAGISCEVFEASTRLGGRVHTARRGALGDGILCELGGEFIDTGHKRVWDLAQRLGLELLDIWDLYEDEDEDRMFAAGAVRTEDELIEALAEVLPVIERDASPLFPWPTRAEPRGAEELDRLSVADYLDRVGVAGWARGLIDGAFLAQYGTEVDRQSALNLLLTIGTDTSEELSLYGESDERYTIRGGNAQLARGLAQRLGRPVQFGHRLQAVRERGASYRVAFSFGGGTLERDFDVVILTVPFTVLRAIELDVELPEPKRRAIDELGYGTNAKVVVGFGEAVWRGRSLTGTSLNDGPCPFVWESSYDHEGEGGALAFFLGGREGVAVGSGELGAHADRLTSLVEPPLGPLQGARNGRQLRRHWPTDPNVRASYSSYRPGQWTTLRGLEAEPVGGLFFAGEHTSLSAQGYMEGAIDSGLRAAESVIRRVRGRDPGSLAG
jgi:monoamine oxidase